MKRKVVLTVLTIVLTSSAFLIFQGNTTEIKSDVIVNPDKWKSLQTIDEDGVVGERVNLWRNNRFWYIGESGYLIDGFENRPGEHPWQGEHLGKWLHAGIIAYKITGNVKMKKAMDEMVERLLATQLPDGYLGTYAEEARFMNVMGSTEPSLLADDIEEDKKEAANAAITGNIRESTSRAKKVGWDTWTFRYNIYGLLTYEKYFPNEKVVDACKKMGDLLINTYGEGKADLTEYGTRKGISATTILESIVMLYQRTGKKKYLDFAEEIVAMSENNPDLRLMGTMLENKSVVHPGEGKGYQLMSNLLGYLRLYQVTDNEKYLRTVINAWNDIKRNHILVTGGPWTQKMDYNGNSECFAYTDDFNPELSHVEGCCDATWIQLCTQLFELTGVAKYYNEAEITVLNSVYGHQEIMGKEWCYFIAANSPKPPHYEDRFHCCGSSEPRALEIYSDHFAGSFEGHLSVNTLAPSTVALSDQFGGGNIQIKGDFPKGSATKIVLGNKKTKNFILEFRVPANSTFNGAKVNGKSVDTKINNRGFVEIDRKWSKGDVVEIDMEFELVATVQPGENGQKWIAFNYGPLALAQKSNTESFKIEPFTDVKFVWYEADKAVDRLKIAQSSISNIAFSIENSDITLIPFYLAGSKTTGPKTYFKCD
ncbi:MAG: glycoside hydrolase family 127 protein [Bacteroidales bacterium]|nr:glycoside hydrolase family 127 protein [Bacteroidales bacterium]